MHSIGSATKIPAVPILAIFFHLRSLKADIVLKMHVLLFLFSNSITYFSYSSVKLHVETLVLTN